MRPGKARRRALERIERLAEQREREADIEQVAFPLLVQKAYGQQRPDLLQRGAGQLQAAIVPER